MGKHAAPVEAKVTAATIAAYLISVAGLAVVNVVESDASLLGPLPDVLEPFVVALAPALAAFLAGYKARHTPRPGE
jgi:uncharacterized membrane protein (Fun14 family)